MSVLRGLFVRQAAEEALPAIVTIMGEELGWDEKEKARQTEMAIGFLRWFLKIEPLKIEEKSCTVI